MCSRLSGYCGENSKNVLNKKNAGKQIVDKLTMNTNILIKEYL